MVQINSEEAVMWINQAEQVTNNYSRKMYVKSNVHAVHGTPVAIQTGVQQM